MAKELSEIEKAEQEERERFNKLLLLIAPLLFGISDVSSFNLVRRSYDREVDAYIRGYGARIKQEIFDTIKKINPGLNAEIYIREAFEFQYKIKGTRATIDLNEILLRRGLKVKGDITAEVMRQTGFNTPSNAAVNAIKKAVLKKNKKSMAQMVGNEMHKVREQAKIDNLIKQGVKARQKVFMFNTQGDDRVRPSHAALAGTELTLSEAQSIKDSILSEIGCRCYLTRI